MKLFDVYPLQDITVVEAKGSFVWDDQGIRYLDLYGGHAVISIGHMHPHWVERIRHQLQSIAFYSNSVHIPLQQELALKLGKLSDKEDYQLFLVNSGAEANENAIKLASFHTGRKRILSFSRAFHGRTSLAVAATDNPAIIAPVNETSYVDFLPFNNEEELEKYFREKGNELAAAIIEPIQGVGGIHIASNPFLQLLRKLCTQYGALLIADEVQCGFGRTGKFFALDHAGVEADIYSMAKGMGNGFPVGGILIAPHIKPKHGMLGTTFGGNHLACAASLAVVEIMGEEDLMNNAAKMGASLMEQLRDFDMIKNIRGKGLMIGFDPIEEWNNIKSILLDRHKIFTGEAKPNTIRLLPALNIGEDEISLLMQAMKLEYRLFTSTLNQ